MAYKFNPLTSQLDIVGEGSGPSPTPTVGYLQSFNATTNWTLDVSVYKIIINEATHLKGINPSVQVFELVAGVYNLVDVDSLEVDNSGQVTIKVLSSPDLRFQGKVLIN